jgi:TetR/AcrR family transcriptional repressor of uid operon
VKVAIAPAPRLRDRQREDTRNRVFDAALAEFRRVGFADAQVSRIATAAGVAHGTFFFHFPSKDHVLGELQRRGELRTVARLATIGRRPRSIRTLLEKIIDAVLAEEEAVGGDLLRELLAVQFRLPPRETSPLIVAVAGLIADAARRGEARSDLAPEALADVFFAAIFGLLLRPAETPPERRPALQHIVDVFVRGMAS